MHTPNLIPYPTHEMTAKQRAEWIAAGCPSPVQYEARRDGELVELPVILRRAVTP
jgi:hypothetical protein